MCTLLRAPVELVEVLVRAKVLGEDTRVADALHCAVHETGVAQVAETGRSAHCRTCSDERGRYLHSEVAH